MSESQNASVVGDETLELDSNHESQSQNNEPMIDSLEGANEALRQKGVEELLGKFLERQQTVEHLLSQILQQQKQTIDNEVNMIERSGQAVTNQTVGGNENSASIYATASDRAARDISAAQSLVQLRDPGGFMLERPSVDLNPRLYYQTLTDEFPRQCARSVEGATHVSHGTRSGVQDKIGRVQDNTSRVFDHESKVLEEARRSLEEERKTFEEERRQKFKRTGARLKMSDELSDEELMDLIDQDLVETYGSNDLRSSELEEISNAEMALMDARNRLNRLKHEAKHRLKHKPVTERKILDQFNVRSCSNLEFSVAGDNRKGMDPREQPRHRPVFALEGRAADPSHFTTDDSGRATTLASKFSFPTRNEDFSTKNVSSQFTLRHDESAGLHLNQSSEA